jgi:hypothetical protein
MNRNVIEKKNDGKNTKKIKEGVNVAYFKKQVKNVKIISCWELLFNES